MGSHKNAHGALRNSPTETMYTIYAETDSEQVCTYVYSIVAYRYHARSLLGTSAYISAGRKWAPINNVYLILNIKWVCFSWSDVQVAEFLEEST